MKGKYGKIIEKFILKVRYLIVHDPKNEQYDLPKELNKINKRNVSVKSSQRGSIMCGSLEKFLLNKKCEIILVCYKILLNKNIKIINVYLLSEKQTQKLICNFTDLIGQNDLQKLKDYFFSLKKTVSKNQRQRYINLSKKLCKNSVLKINCKLSSSNQRIQCSFTLKKLFEHYSLKKLKKFSGRIIVPKEF